MTRWISVILSTALVLGLSGMAAAQDAVVSASSLNLRAGPGDVHRVIARMPEGARVRATNCGPEWCQVRFGRARGFAAARFLDLSSGVEAQAAVPPASPSAPAAGTGYAVWSDPAPERAARVWRWQDPTWRDRHARTVQWLHRHREN